MKLLNTIAAAALVCALAGAASAQMSSGTMSNGSSKSASSMSSGSMSSSTSSMPMKHHKTKHHMMKKHMMKKTMMTDGKSPASRRKSSWTAGHADRGPIVGGFVGHRAKSGSYGFEAETWKERALVALEE